ncbi:MAG: tetratricopeptide repeat protein [Bacteroidota bacterium]
MSVRDNFYSVQKETLSLSTIQLMRDDESKVKALLSYAADLSSKEPDSALELSQQARKLSERLDYLEGLAESFNVMGIIHWVQSEFQKAVDYHNQALEIWKVLKARKGIAKSFTGQGNAFAKLGDFQKSLELYFKALAIYKEKGIQEGIARCYNNIGIVYKSLGEYEKSLENYFKSLRIKEILGDQAGVGYSYNNVGTVLYYLKDYKKALDYQKKALAIFEESGNLSELANAYANMGVTYAGLNHYKKALKFLEQALKLKEDLGERSGLVPKLIQIGDIHFRRKDYPEALNSLFKALVISEEVQFQEGISDCLYRIGEVYQHSADPQKAIEFLERALKSNKKLGLKEATKNAYRAISDAYYSMEDYKKAFEYQALYMELKENLVNQEKNKVISELQAHYEMEKKDLEIEKLNIEQKFLRHTNKELEQFANKAAHDLKEPLRMMSNFSGLLLRRYGDRLDENGQEFLNIIQDAAKRMNSLLSSMLEYAKTGTESERVMEVNLNEIVKSVEGNLQLAIKENDAKLIYSSLPTVRAATPNLLQLFQNLVSNAIKFRKNIAPIIEITHEKKEHFFLFSVKDNGIGISKENISHIFDLFHRLNPKEDYEGSGIGLATCKRIIENLGGQIWVESVKGTGTTIFFTLPIPEDTF